MWVEDKKIKEIRGKLYLGTYISSFGYAAVMDDERLKARGKSITGFQRRFINEIKNAVEERFGKTILESDIRIKDIEKEELKEKIKEIQERTSEDSQN